MGYELRSSSRRNQNQVGLILTMTESLSSIRLQEEVRSNSSSYDESTPTTPQQQRMAATETVRGRMVTYDNRDLPENLWERAYKGIGSDNFAIDKCAEFEQRGYYAFRIVDSKITEEWSTGDMQSESGGVTVRIGHVKDEYGQPACSCAEFSETRSSCSHIFWLMDQILDYSGETDLSTSGNDLDTTAISLPLQANGSALMTSSAFDQIDRVGLLKLAKSKNWEYFRPNGTNFSEFNTVSADGGIPDDKEEQVLDMLACYASTDSPYYDRDGILGSSNSLASAVYRMSINNPHVFRALRAETPETKCAESYIDKIRKQVRETFRRWITFIETGIPSGPEARPDQTSEGEDNGAPTTDWCAKQLRRYVQEIEVAIDKRRRGINLERKREIMELLILVLSEIVQYHFNPPQRRTDLEKGAVTSPVPSLYDLLLNDVRVLPHESNFIISTMRKLVSAGSSFLEKLEDLLSDVRSAGAPTSYINDFSTIITEVRDYQALVQSPSSPALKRRGVDLESPTKRRFNPTV